MVLDSLQFLSSVLNIGLEFDGVWQAILFVLGGLGVFLFGIHMMGSSLKDLAGDRLRVIIQKSTRTPFMGMIVGFAVTMLTQSSSTTSAIAVGLVGAGLMTFGQSIGVLLGANIGGTVLPLMMAALPPFVKPIVAVVLVFAGASLVFFFKRDKIRQVGSVMLGFGLIFLGLTFIDLSFDYIQTEHQEFITNMFTELSNIPELAVLVGILFTLIVQSSAATIGIAQGLFSVGSMSLSGSLAIMLGANLGTTITAIIACVGSSRTAKKVAVANTLIKFTGVLIFTIIFRFAFYPLMNTINNAMFGEGANNPLIISFSHIGFNIINSILILIILKPFVKLCDKIVPEKEEKSIEDALLDYTLIKKSPNLALSFVKKAIDYMADEVENYEIIAHQYAFERDDDLIDTGIEYERTINCLDKRIHDYLIKLTIQNLDTKSSTLLSKYLDQIKDLERVGDHCTNLFEFFQDRYEKDMHLSDDGQQDLEQMFATVEQMTKNTVKALKTWDVNLAKDTMPLEDETDNLEEIFRERHVHRVQSGLCSFINTQHYVEILSNLERMGDHLQNVLESIASAEYCKDDEFHH